FAYFLTWSNAPVGFHSLTAVATASNGLSAVSSAVVIFVVSNIPPPPPPAVTVTITQPSNGSSFTLPANIQIDATTTDTNGTVASVAFLAAASFPHPEPEYVLLLGVVSNGVPGPGSNQEQFSITWSNPPVGTWFISASANPSNSSNQFGGGVSSTPVAVTVLPAIPALSVDIATPSNGEIFAVSANIQIIAGVTDTNGPVAEVQFFDGTNSIGIVSNGVPVASPGSPGLAPGSLAYTLNWSNASVGFHDLTAVATDTNGMSAVSARVFITVVPVIPPIVRITSPANHSVFEAPVNIELFAYATDLEGTVSNVQFFAGSNSLGFGLPVLVHGPVSPGPVWTNPPVVPLSTFELLWTNPVPDSYVLTAVATFSTGASTTSAPVDITVVGATPPPTNRPDLVNIVGTDPIAIEGTNCWTWPGLTNTSTNTPPSWSNWMSPNALWCSFTNCGPKDATFTVRRHGDTSNDLTVNYTIGGMASNGVDYVALPGSVVIPAGQRDAMITIVPIDADTNNTPDTVILTLSADTNNPPDYRVGFPPSAEALILNSEAPFPRLTGRMLHDHTFCLSMNGPDGGWFRVDFSVDCLNWTPVCTNQVVDGMINFADPNASGSTARWYRTVPLPSGPSN
ncbi:MAG TPA: Ig-like domain-containing protein, partial [Verrucomicrobiae bacterium]|nr:Ig-like domain-containing protein [Verrucomicrobiae bacterium]